MFTAHHEPGRCFEETRDGTIPVKVYGDWLPRSLCGRFFALFAYIRMIVLALCVVFLEKDPVDVYFCDVVSACIPVLRLRRGVKVSERESYSMYTNNYYCTCRLCFTAITPTACLRHAPMWRSDCTGFPSTRWRNAPQAWLTGSSSTAALPAPSLLAHSLRLALPMFFTPASIFLPLTALLLLTRTSAGLHPREKTPRS